MTKPIDRGCFGWTLAAEHEQFEATLTQARSAAIGRLGRTSAASVHLIYLPFGRASYSLQVSGDELDVVDTDDFGTGWYVYRLELDGDNVRHIINGSTSCVARQDDSIPAGRWTCMPMRDWSSMLPASG
jgi:hypothetical protein